SYFQSDIVEEETRAQSKSNIWFDQRSGRITASTFKAATKTDITKPSVSLIRKICYPKSHSFTSEATRWGCTHEELARNYYEIQHRLAHSDVLVETAGFRISPTHPFIGASPDGYVSCSCCGPGVIEIKCTFCAKDLSVDEAADLGNFCLEKNEQGTIRLKPDHAYYYHVQMQIFVTDRQYCDFVLWTERDRDSPFVERVTANDSFFDKQLECAKAFYKKCILPELLGKTFSAPKPAAACADNGQQWCYCREPEDRDMLVCTSSFCSIKKFHKTCLHLKRNPKQWKCPSCRKVINSQKKKSLTS
uniref:YqaJ viral recombinase domain-containing protein n=1 Tax=Nothobranchius furzeri TaxID=105023 RepID=A0A8C6LGZ3_NOTFU